MVVVVDSVDDLLLAVLEYLPNCAADHVAAGQGSDLQTLAFAFQAHRLRVLELLHALEGRVDVVQREQVELFVARLRLIIRVRVARSFVEFIIQNKNN